MITLLSSLFSYVRPLVQSYHPMDQAVVNDMDSRVKSCLDAMTTNATEVNAIINELYIQLNCLRQRVVSLEQERRTLSAEVDSLQAEIQMCNEEKEMMRTELREVRHDNDLLIDKLKVGADIVDKIVGKKSIQSNGIVNSLPAFSEQMVLRERSNSMTDMGSLGLMTDGLRLMSTSSSTSESTSYHSSGKDSNFNVRQLSTSDDDDTYYTTVAADSTHRLFKKGCSIVESNGCRQKQFSSTSVNDICGNEALISTTDSCPLGIDDNNNNDDLSLKSVEVPINCALDMSALESLSSTESLEMSNKHKSVTKTTDHRIPAPIIPDSSDGLIVTCSHLVSPSLFYVHINDTQVGIAQLDDMEDGLNLCYSAICDTDCVTVGSDVCVDSFWCYKRCDEERWYRVRVIQVTEEKAFVDYIDYGNQEWVEFRHLVPVTRKFATCPALAVKCCLSNVYPYGNHWSQRGLDYFLSFVDDQRLCTAFIGHKPKEFTFESILPVFLWTNESTEPTAKDIYINYALVAHNYAVTDDHQWLKEAERTVKERTPPQVTDPSIGCHSSESQINANTVKVWPQLSHTSYDSLSGDDEDWEPVAERMNGYSIYEDGLD